MDYVALPPAGGPRPDAPVVVAYHLLDTPRTPEAFAHAVPLDGLDAWKLYFGLPLSAGRLPAGGEDELWRMLMSDAVLKVHRHVTLGALREFPSLYAEARARHDIAAGVPLGVMGGSMGGAAAQLVMAESGEHVSAAVLINPVVRMRDSIDALTEKAYVWNGQSNEVAERVDFVRRAGELRNVRFITGADDRADAFLDPVSEAVVALREHGVVADHREIAGMGHALSEGPHTAEVDRLAVAWFEQHLGLAR